MAGYDAPDYKTILWDERGSPYWMTASGKKTFIPPLTAGQYHDDPRMMAWAKSKGVEIDYQKDPETGQTTVGEGGVKNNAAPKGSLFRNRGTWDSEEGDWDQSLNWGNILSMAIAGTMTAGAAYAAMGGGAPASAALSTAMSTGSAEAGLAAATAGAGVGIGETAAVAGLAGSGFGTGAGLGAAAVPAALGGTTASTAGTLGTVGKLARAANTARDVGGAISNASSAAAGNRRDDATIGQSAQRTYEGALMDRAKLESDQRRDASRDIYRSSFYKNERPGPNNARGLSPVSPEYMQSLSDLERQGLARLKTDPMYEATKLKPLEERDVPEAGKLERAGSWIGPTLSVIGSLAGYRK